MCIKAVEQDGYALRYVKEQTEAVCIIGIVWPVAAHIRNSPPERPDNVIVRNPSPVPSPVLPAIPLVERLRMPWNSESDANWPVAETLAMVSEVAYLSPVEAESRFSQMGFKQTKTFLGVSTVGYVASCDDVAVVVFRGTDNIPNWLINLDCLSTKTPHGAIHKGFHDSYEAMKSQIVTILGQTKANHLWITGHSLGGASALVCACDFVENKTHAMDGVITFGQPMVAYEELARYIDNLLLGRYAHFVNEKDIVPRVPTAPYYHSRSLVWFTEGGVKRSRPLLKVQSAAAHDVRAWSGPLSKTSEKTGEVLAASDDGPPPLTKEQFEEIKVKLQKPRSIDHPIDRARVKTMEADLWESQGGTPPFDKMQFEKMEARLWGTTSLKNIDMLRDHSMSIYLEKVRSLLKNSNAK